jgi:hypothetical protein
MASITKFGATRADRSGQICEGDKKRPRHAENAEAAYPRLALGAGNCGQCSHIKCVLSGTCFYDSHLFWDLPEFSAGPRPTNAAERAYSSA